MIKYFYSDPKYKGGSSINNHQKPETNNQIGRGERIRTSDPCNPIAVRYQTAPRPGHVIQGNRKVLG